MGLHDQDEFSDDYCGSPNMQFNSPIPVYPSYAATDSSGETFTFTLTAQ